MNTMKHINKTVHTSTLFEFVFFFVFVFECLCLGLTPGPPSWGDVGVAAIRVARSGHVWKLPTSKPNAHSWL